ncbi:hypothetical protein LCGC14_2724310, partial [marine sediment metagenome]
MLSMAAAAGCGKEPAPATAPRPRLVTFSPALTAIVFDMGLGEHVVGVTSYCVLPAGQDRPVVGDRVKLNAEAILSMSPDAVLIQQDAKAFSGVRKVNPKIRIEQFEIERLADITSAIGRIGRITGKEAVAEEFKKGFQARLAAVRAKAKGRARPRVLFVLGYDKPYVAADDNFIHDLIELAGGVNAGAEVVGR